MCDAATPSAVVPQCRTCVPNTQGKGLGEQSIIQGLNSNCNIIKLQKQLWELADVTGNQIGDTGCANN